jgi:hypothetical protein
MIRKVVLLIFTLVIVGSIHSVGQVKYSNEFLAIGVGARTMGMGGAGIANVDDATAGYWNPARLAGIDDKFDVTLMHSEYFAGIAKYDYLGTAYRIDEKTVAGLSFIRLAVDDIPNTLELIDANGNFRYDQIRHFSAADLGILFSLGRKSGIDGLSYGGNFKIIHRRTGEFAQAWGFGLDASANYLTNGWHFAAMARDITGTFNAWVFQNENLKEVFELTGNELPENSLEITNPSLILGVAREFKISEKISAAVDLDLRMYFDGQRHVLIPMGFTGIDPYLGSEWIYNGWIALRVGVGQFQWTDGLDGDREMTLQPNIGVGIKFKNLRLDYALTDIGDLAVAQYSNIISIRYSIK